MKYLTATILFTLATQAQASSELLATRDIDQNAQEKIYRVVDENSNNQMCEFLSTTQKADLMAKTSPQTADLIDALEIGSADSMTLTEGVLDTVKNGEIVCSKYSILSVIFAN